MITLSWAGIALSYLNAGSDLILITTLWGQYYYSPLLYNKENEAQTGFDTGLRSHS